MVGGKEYAPSTILDIIDRANIINFIDGINDKDASQEYEFE